MMSEEIKSFSLILIVDLKNRYGDLLKYEYSSVEDFHYIVIYSKDLYNNQQFSKDIFHYQQKAFQLGIDNFGFALANIKERRLCLTSLL